MSRKQNVNHIWIGSGRLFIGGPRDERFIGNVIGGFLKEHIEGIKLCSGSGPVPEMLANNTKTLSYTPHHLELSDLTLEGMALFLGGEVRNLNQTEAIITGEEHTARQGLWCYLGISKTDPSGVGVISAAAADTSITDQSGSTSYTAIKDYVVDAEHGSIYIVPGGSIEDEMVIRVNYKRLANTKQRVTVRPDHKLITTTVRYEENTGEVYEFNIP